MNQITTLVQILIFYLTKILNKILCFMETIKEMITKRDNKRIRENWKRINKLIK